MTTADLEDDFPCAELKDLSKHIWHGKVIITVPHYDEANVEGNKMWDAIDVLRDFPGWDICAWNYWETNTLFEISWSADTKEARDAVTRCMMLIETPYARHVYECCVPCGVMISHHHWKDAELPPADKVIGLLRIYGSKATFRETQMMRADAEAKLAAGWIQQDVVQYLKCTEMFDPELPEDVALARMKVIGDRYGV